LEAESDFGDHAERAEGDDSAEEGVAVFGAGEMDKIAGGVDEFERGDSGREVAELFSRTVSGGGDRAGDGDVRKRSEVVERKAFGVEVWAELAVGHSSGDGNGAGGFVERDDVVHVFEREELARAVGDGVEAVARAEDFEL